MSIRIVALLLGLGMVQAGCASGTCLKPTKPDEALFNPDRYECKWDFCPENSYEFAIVRADPANCNTSGGNACVDQTDEGGFNYRFESDEYDLTVVFDPSVGSQPTDQQMMDALLLVSLERVRAEPTEEEGLYVQFRSVRWEAANPLDTLTIQNGQLRATGTAIVNSARYDYHDIGAPFCPNVDIVADCSCRFTGLEIPVSIEVDVQLNLPGS